MLFICGAIIILVLYLLVLISLNYLRKLSLRTYNLNLYFIPIAHLKWLIKLLNRWALLSEMPVFTVSWVRLEHLLFIYFFFKIVVVDDYFDFIQEFGGNVFGLEGVFEEFKKVKARIFLFHFFITHLNLVFIISFRVLNEYKFTTFLQYKQEQIRLEVCHCTQGWYSLNQLALIRFQAIEFWKANPSQDF